MEKKSEKTERQPVSKEAAERYKTHKKAQERVLEETKPGTVLRDNPDYKKIVQIIESGG